MAREELAAQEHAYKDQAKRERAMEGAVKPSYAISRYGVFVYAYIIAIANPVLKYIYNAIASVFR